MISSEMRARIRRLFYGEHWKVGTIAEQLGVHHETVKRAIEVDRLVSRGTARPSDLDPYVSFIRETLEQYPRLTGTRLHEMLRLRGYEGSVGQVRRRIRQLGLRPKPSSEAFFRLRVMPGEQAQADWAHFGTIRMGLFERPLFAFVMVLSWSRAVHVYFSLDQTMPSVVRGHVEAFQAFGGCARQILYDNMKTVVLERMGDAIRFHPRLLDLAGHYLFAPYPCRPGRGNEKGRVERKIRHLRTSFFDGRRFGDLDDLRCQFLEWRDDVAYQRPCPADRTLTVCEALEKERDKLLPLPVHPFDSDEVRPVLARKQPYVIFDTNHYSIPHKLVGVPLTLVASETKLRILDGQTEVARHQRLWGKHITSEQPAHLEGLLEQKRKARTLKGRERLLDELPEAKPLIEALARRNEPLGPHTAKLLRLLDAYGPDVTADAVKEAVERDTPRAESVAYIIDRSIDPRDPVPRPLAILNRPEVDDLRIRNHDLEDYDELTDRPQ